MTIDAAFLVLGAATLGLGLLSDALELLWLSLPLPAVVLGVVLRPEVLRRRRLPPPPSEPCPPVPQGRTSRSSLVRPLGVAAVYYATFVERYGPSHGTIFRAATLAIAVTVLAHSISATPAVRHHAGRSPFTTLANPLRPDTDEAP